jgi:HD superfamily phosphohydrolase
VPQRAQNSEPGGEPKDVAPDLLSHAKEGDHESATGGEDGRTDAASADPKVVAGADELAAGDLLPAVMNIDPEIPDTLDKETLLPVSGFVRLSRRELQVIDHPAFQRLFDIYQLGQTHLVYRGATHSRGQHSIGTLHVVTEMADALVRNCATTMPPASEHWQLSTPLIRIERSFVRLGALLHDVGHLAAGHTLEDELVLLPPHDADARLNMVLDKTNWHGVTVTPLRARIDELYAADTAQSDTRDAASQRTLTASEIVLRLVSKDHPDAPTATTGAIRFEVCRDLIGNTICADLLDYLHRDYFNLGRSLQFNSRLLDYLEIHTRKRSAPDRVEHKLVVNLRGGTRPRPDAVTAILELLESRYQLAEIALFHRTKVTAAAMLERALAEWSSSLGDGERGEAMDDLLATLLECADVEMLTTIEHRISDQASTMGAERAAGAQTLLRSLRIRRLHRELKSYYDEDLSGRGQGVRERFFGDPQLSGAERAESRRAAADNRLQALRTLEADFQLPPGSVVMYCPPHGMNTKIAQVNVLRDDSISELWQVERGEQDWVTGGHLNTLERRFHRLWRITFAIERSAHDRMQAECPDGLDELLEVIELAILRLPPKHGDRDEAMAQIARRIAEMPGSMWSDATPREYALNRGAPAMTYPGGIPCVRALLNSR